MPRKYIPTAIKKLIRERAQSCCEYCKSLEEFATEGFTIEHIIPIAKGGLDDIENLALACFGCNSFKTVKTEAIDPESGTLVLLFHPRKEEWSDHFEWSDDYTEIIGKTSSGRATVVALKLNREGLLNLREVLHQWGVHPRE
ncbi:MAG: HNH endonuclease [Bacteroidota bacterium]